MTAANTLKIHSRFLTKNTEQSTYIKLYNPYAGQEAPQAFHIYLARLGKIPYHWQIQFGAGGFKWDGNCLLKDIW